MERSEQLRAEHRPRITPARWSVIRRVFHDAIDLPPDERAGFLFRTAGADEALRLEVESLLDSHDRAASFIERPDSWVPAAGLDQIYQTADQIIGRRFGAYEIL